MRKLTLLLLCLITLTIQAQDLIIYQKNTTENYLIRYQSSADHNQAIINQMLAEYARALNKGVYNLEFSFSHQQKILLSKKGPKLTIDIDMLDFVSKSELFYKQFNISEYFLPTNVAFTGELLKADNLIQSYQINNTSIGDSKRFTFYHTDSSIARNYRFIVKTKSFSYENNTVQELKERLNQIDDYYAWDIKMRNALGDLEIMNPNNPDQLERNNNAVRQMEDMLLDFDRSQMQNTLNLQSNDPIQLLNRISFLDQKLKQAREAINYTYSILHEIFYRRALEAMLAGDSHRAKSLLMQSLDANHSFAPALFQLASIDFSEGKTGDAAEKITSLFHSMTPDPETALMATELAHDIYADYLSYIESLIASAKFQQALGLIPQVEAYCQNLYVVPCTDAIVKNQILAHRGQYQSLITESKSYLQSDNLQAADEYIDEAIAYQSKYNAYIPDGNDAQQLKNRIKEAQYKLLIQNGRINLKNGAFDLAFDQFKEAKKLEQQYQIAVQSDLTSLLKQAAKPLIIEYIYKGHNSVDINNTDKAHQYLKSAMDLKNKYFPSPDEEIEEKINTLKGEIFSQQCQNAENAYQTYVASGIGMSEALQYIEAERLLLLAVAEHTKLPDCGLDISEAENELFRIKPAATFLKMIAESQLLKNKSKYQQAIEKYNEAGDYFIEQQVGLFDITYKAVLDYIISGDNNFVKYGVSYFAKANELNNALSLLHELKNRGYASKYLKLEQQVLGEKLAESDANSGMTGKSKELVLNYTQADKWYKYLTKAYKKQWKKM